MTSVLNTMPEFRVNTTTFSTQMDPSVVTLSDGTYIVAWEGAGAGDGYGIFGQHYDATGHKIGMEFQINTAGAPDQHSPKIALLEDGGFVVTWYSGGQDGSSYGIYAQRYDAGFHVVGGETLVNTTTTGSQITPSVTAVNDGGYVVTWLGPDANNGGIYSQTYNANGVKVGGETLVNTTTGGNQERAVTAQLYNDAYIVVWVSNGQDNVDGSRGVYMQRYFVGGTPIGSETRVNSVTANDQSDPAVCVLTNGGFVITWSSEGQDGDGTAIMSQQYNNAGAKVGGEVLVNQFTLGDQLRPVIAALDDGGWVIAFQDDNQDGEGFTGISAQRFDAGGNAIGEEIYVNNQSLGGYQTTPALAALADGGFVVTYTDDSNDGDNQGVYQRVYSAATGLNGMQTLYGTADSDVLDGGSGGDTMYGGKGDDTYYVNSVSDYVIELDGEGDDTIVSSISLPVLAFNIENLTLTGSAALNGEGNELDNVIIGNAGSNQINGNDGNDTISGGGGNDVLDGGSGDNYIDGGAGNDALSAGDGNNVMYGGDGGDSITGGLGDDNIDGGSGNDAISGGDGNDTIDAGSGNDSANGDGGDDMVMGGAGSDTLSGGDGDDYVYGGDQNDRIYASIGTDHVYGDGGSDTYDASSMGGSATIDLNRGKAVQDGNTAWLDGIENATGSAANDTITGNSLDNIIDGGAGADKMSGSLGNDTYYVDDTGDTVTESSNASLGGDDTVISFVSFTLGSYIENLTLADLFDINGNGNASDNVIIGNSGINLIDGKAGNDTMVGGDGNDTYWVDVAGDVVTELAGQGTDTVRAGLTYTLGANLENLILTGTGDFNATGNAAVNQLTGNAGNNILDGQAGADTMSGGAGNDTYIVDNAGDNVVEADGAGTDLINSSVSYSLSGRFIETLALTGSGNINATGNSKANILVSNTGNNSLTGGGGADLFVFQTGSHADTITDFTSSQGDSIDASAYHAVSHTVTLSGTSVIIDFGGGNTVTVLNATVGDVTAHTVF